MLFANKISLKNISFAYENTENEILNNINIEIKKDSILLIQGKSGTGKSSIKSVLL